MDHRPVVGVCFTERPEESIFKTSGHLSFAAWDCERSFEGWYETMSRVHYGATGVSIYHQRGAHSRYFISK